MRERAFMRFNFSDYSLRIKVFFPTLTILSIVAFIYLFVFTNLFFQVKNDAFTDHKLLLELDHKIAYLGLQHHQVDHQALDELSDFTSAYFRHVIKTDGEDEEEELILTQQIIELTDAYISKYRVWSMQSASKPLQTHNSLHHELLALKQEILLLIEQALEVVQQEADEDLETLLYYLISSFILLFALILAFVMTGTNYVLKPLIRLRQKIDDFRGEHALVANETDSGDEITQLIHSFRLMRDDIELKQALLEKERVKAEEANLAKSEFLANISHELRTPMVGILGFAELGMTKLERADKIKLQKYFERIHLSGSRLLTLLNNLLDLSKLEAGQMQFDFTLVDISDVIKDTVEELDPLMRMNKLSFDMYNALSTSAVEMDKERMYQVFYNVMSNAIKFSPTDGKIKVSLFDDEIEHDEHVIPAVRVEFEDQGVGIPSDEIELIFDKFAQSSTTNTGAGGTGLGLSICKDICRYHFAKVWAENVPKPGRGAKFIFLIPKNHPSDI